MVSFKKMWVSRTDSIRDQWCIGAMGCERGIPSNWGRRTNGTLMQGRTIQSGMGPQCVCPDRLVIRIVDFKQVFDEVYLDYFITLSRLALDIMINENVFSLVSAIWCIITSKGKSESFNFLKPPDTQHPSHPTCMQDQQEVGPLGHTCRM